MMLRLSQNSVTTSNGKLENSLRNNEFILKWIRLIMTFSSYNRKMSKWKTYFDQHCYCSFRHGFFIPVMSPLVFFKPLRLSVHLKSLAKFYKPRDPFLESAGNLLGPISIFLDVFYFSQFKAAKLTTVEKNLSPKTLIEPDNLPDPGPVSRKSR